MGLCKHIFKVRTILKIPLFEKSLFKQRWMINYYKTQKMIRIEPPDTEQPDLQEMVQVVVQPTNLPILKTWS